MFQGEGGQDSPRELRLLGLREAPVEEGCVDVHVAFADRRDEWLDPGPQALEDWPKLRRCHAGLEIIEQRVIRVVVRRKALDVLAPQLDNALEVGEEGGEVRALPGLNPGVLRHRG